MKKLLSSILLFCLPLIMHSQEQFSVYFDSNKAAIQGKELVRLGDWMTANKESKIVAIDGFTDEDGTTGLNDTLAKERVQTVYDVVKQRVKIREDYKSRSYGELHKHSPKKAENRKVTIFYIEAKDMVRENEILGIKPAPKAPKQKVSYPEKITLNSPNGKKEEITLDREFMQKVDVSKPGDVLKLDNLNFYENTFAILPEARPKMFELLEIMKANKSLKIKILGHICCNEGDPRDLSTKRAKAIMMFLNGQGIDKSRLSFQGMGTSQPINPLPEADEPARAQNRRVEIMIVEN